MVMELLHTNEVFGRSIISSAFRAALADLRVDLVQQAINLHWGVDLSGSVNWVDLVCVTTRSSPTSLGSEKMEEEVNSPNVSSGRVVPIIVVINSDKIGPNHV